MKGFKFFQKEPISHLSPPMGYSFFGLTPIMYNPTTFDGIRVILYRNDLNGAIIKGETITEDHELWNYREDH